MCSWCYTITQLFTTFITSHCLRIEAIVISKCRVHRFLSATVFLFENWKASLVIFKYLTGKRQTDTKTPQKNIYYHPTIMFHNWTSRKIVHCLDTVWLQYTTKFLNMEIRWRYLQMQSIIATYLFILFLFIPF